MIGRVFKHVRSKPKGVRDQYAFWIAAVFTGLIILMWVWQLPDRFEETSGTVVNREEAESEPAFGGLLDQFSDRISNIREEVSEFTATTSKETAEPEIDLSIVASSTVQASSTAETPTPSTGRAIRIATTSPSGTSAP